MRERVAPLRGMPVRVYARACVCLSVCICACMRAYVYACVCVGVYACAYAFVRARVCVHFFFTSTLAFYVYVYSFFAIFFLFFSLHSFHEMAKELLANLLKGYRRRQGTAADVDKTIAQVGGACLRVIHGKKQHIKVCVVFVLFFC